LEKVQSSKFFDESAGSSPLGVRGKRGLGSKFKVQSSKFKCLRKPTLNIEQPPERRRTLNIKLVPSSKFQVQGSKFNMKIERFEDLEIWQVARELCKIVYEIKPILLIFCPQAGRAFTFCLIKK